MSRRRINSINSICVLRLSAIGDVLMALPAVIAIKKQYPQFNITWLVGKTEVALLRNINNTSNIEFVVFDKRHSIKAWFALRQKLKKRRFDVLLNMQPTLRANVISLAINADKKIGFDDKRSKEGQRFFVNEQLTHKEKAHYVDGFFQFAQHLGCNERSVELPTLISNDDKAFVKVYIEGPKNKKMVIINACASSSFSHRNWCPEKFAELTKRLIEAGHSIVLVGAKTTTENNTAKYIESKINVTNLVGKTTLTQLIALIAQADCLISVDSAPVHMADIVATPVVGLYGVTNPSQTGSYCYPHYTISHYPHNVAWGARFKNTTFMDSIGVDEVAQMVEKVLVECGEKKHEQAKTFLINKYCGD